MAILLDGRALAATIRKKMKQRVAPMATPPGLAVILVGDDPASQTYVRLKGKACEEAGIRFEKFAYPTDVATSELIERVRELNAQADVNGILVQLPLPGQNTDAVIAAIDPFKDVDGFHPENLRRMEAGKPSLVSPVALGIVKLLESSGERIQDQSVVIVASDLFARPMASLLRERRPREIEVIASHQKNLPEKTRGAKLVIMACGIPHLLTGGMVSPGAVVIDVGTTRIGDDIVGDVEASSVEPVAGWLTPVPGGVGPMTVAMLLVNVVKAAELQRAAARSDV